MGTVGHIVFRAGLMIFFLALYIYLATSKGDESTDDEDDTTKYKTNRWYIIIYLSIITLLYGIIIYAHYKDTGELAEAFLLFSLIYLFLLSVGYIPSAIILNKN